MRLKIKKEILLPILSQIQGILEKRSTLPIFSNVLIQSEKDNLAHLYASDSELSFSACFSAEEQKKISVVLNGKRLFEIVRELKEGFFEISSVKDRIQIKQGSSVFKLNGLNVEDFPSFPELKEKKKHRFLCGDFLDMIDKTLYCVSLDESRYHLTGVFLEPLDSKFRFVATDGHRMSFVDLKGDFEKNPLDQGIIIPRKGLQELKKMLALGDVKDFLDFYIEKPRVLVKFKNQSLNIRLIEGQYPNYKRLIPTKKGSEVLISTEEFLSSLKRISVLTTARFKGVNFTFHNNKLSIHFSHPEVGEAFEELDCQYSGEDFKIRFNSKYILEILQSINEKNVKLLLTDNSSPGLIRPQGREDYTCLVMPMKL